MKILIIEPYFTGSHADWAKGYQKFSRHDVHILSLSGQFWKWRMHGGAVTLAQKFLGSDFSPDFILATDMLDLTTFLALTRKKTHAIPTGIYFHENQISYPWSSADRDVLKKRDHHYGFINYVSALAADAVFFNSHFHRTSFFADLPKILRHFPDHRGMDNIKKLEQKSKVLYLGLDLQRFDEFRVQEERDKPLILWNHRWEYDKNPGDFFLVLNELKNDGIDFEIAVLGENFSKVPIIFEPMQSIFKKKIVQYGFAKTFEEYARWLWRAHIIPITSRQDFFGASLVEAVYCNCYPILPKRLAFPEIISIDIYPKNFYNDMQDLYDKLEIAIENFRSLKTGKLRELVSKFDWRKMASEYDNQFELIAQRHN